jgi:hypothetical protein
MAAGGCHPSPVQLEEAERLDVRRQKLVVVVARSLVQHEGTQIDRRSSDIEENV